MGADRGGPKRGHVEGHVRRHATAPRVQEARLARNCAALFEANPAAAKVKDDNGNTPLAIAFEKHALAVHPAAFGLERCPGSSTCCSRIENKASGEIISMLKGCAESAPPRKKPPKSAMKNKKAPKQAGGGGDSSTAEGGVALTTKFAAAKIAK